MGTTEWVAESRYSDRWPGFKGSIEFDLTLELFGERITRLARFNYVHTPEWEYFDLHNGALRQSHEASKYELLLLTVPAEDTEYEGDTAGDDPEVDGDDDKPEWVSGCGITEIGVLNRNVWEHLRMLIEERCKAEDAERRRAAGI